jgi:hypothetical protein
MIAITLCMTRGYATARGGNDEPNSSFRGLPGMGAEEYRKKAAEKLNIIETKYLLK